MIKIIITTFLSATIFSFLFYILNNKICGIFKIIQRDLANLTKSTKSILKVAGFILAILISIYFKIILNLNEIKTGLILGFLNAIIDTCFKDNIIENIIQNNQ